MGLKDIIIEPSEQDTELLRSFDKDLLRTSSKKALNIPHFLSSINKGLLRSGGIHEFLERSQLHFCSTPSEPRNPELEARIERLKAERANAEYKAMTKFLYPDDRQNMSLREDVKSVTSQMTAVINFVLSVVGSFFFAYKAVEYALPEQNIPAQVMMGIITSTVVALADLFFLARTI